jgi:hypothetical protein
MSTLIPATHLRDGTVVIGSKWTTNPMDDTVRTVTRSTSWAVEYSFDDSQLNSVMKHSEFLGCFVPVVERVASITSVVDLNPWPFEAREVRMGPGWGYIDDQGTVYPPSVGVVADRTWRLLVYLDDDRCCVASSQSIEAYRRLLA